MIDIFTFFNSELNNMTLYLSNIHTLLVGYEFLTNHPTDRHSDLILEDTKKPEDDDIRLKEWVFSLSQRGDIEIGVSTRTARNVPVETFSTAMKNTDWCVGTIRVVLHMNVLYFLNQDTLFEIKHLDDDWLQRLESTKTTKIMLAVRLRSPMRLTFMSVGIPQRLGNAILRELAHQRRPQQPSAISRRPMMPPPPSEPPFEV